MGLESILFWLGSLISQGISAAGERVGQNVPVGRPIDMIAARRRMSREMAELQDLYTRLCKQAERAEETCNNLCWRVVLEVLDPTPDELLSPIVEAARRLCWELLLYEGYYPLLQIDLQRQLSIGEMWEFTKNATRQLEFYEKPEGQQQIEETLRLFLYNLLHERLPQFPVREAGEEEALLVPLVSLHRAPAEDIEALLHITFRKSEDDGIFSRLAETLLHNLLLASGIDPDQSSESSKQAVKPTALRDKSPSELVQTYLGQTPFTDFFNTPVPFTIPLPSRFEHMHIVGGSGHGKTQLLQHLILRDLHQLRQGKGSIIVIDSQGDMLRNILSLAEVGEIAERVMLIDPNDIAYPPALNLFDFGMDRLTRYAALEQEKLINGAIALYEYVFGALLGAQLTARQGVIFRYLARLMMVVPGATIHTLMNFMEDPQATTPHIVKLDGTAAHFFKTQFFSKAFDDTRQQILTRLWGVLSNRVLERMFANERNKLNLFAAMNTGSLILINTAKDLLKQEGCEILGRFFIALICQAAQERASIREEERMSTFVYIDEAHDYFDESMENLLNQARKYMVGLVLAHQNLDQFETRLRATVMASTSIKLVGGLSAKDAAAFGREMRCDGEFLQSMRKSDKQTQFACFVRNHTERPIPLTIPFGTMEQQPKMTAEVYSALIERNHSRYCATIDNHSIPHSQEQTPEGHTTLEKPEML